MAVFESTAAEHRGLARPRLPEISVISPGLDTRPSITGPVRVPKKKKNHMSLRYNKTCSEQIYMRFFCFLCVSIYIIDQYCQRCNCFSKP